MGMKCTELCDWLLTLDYTVKAGQENRPSNVDNEAESEAGITTEIERYMAIQDKPYHTKL
jgi:hypothetical protein